MTVTLTLRQVCLPNKSCRYFPPNLNARIHWAVRSKWTAAFKEAVWAELNTHGNRAKIWELLKTRTGKAIVNITFYTCHLMDYDNAYGSAKPLVDALKGQAIEDDKPDKLTLYVTSEKVKHLKDQCTEIIIS